MTLKYILVFIAITLVVSFAFGILSNYIVSSKIGVIEFYEYPTAKYTGKNMLRYFSAAANFLNKFSHNTFAKANPRLSSYYELLEDYKPNLFSFIWYDKYMAVDSIKSDVAQYNFISIDTLYQMRFGFKQSDMDKFCAVFTECLISHPYYDEGCKSTATFSDNKSFQYSENDIGYLYYNDLYDGSYISIPRAICFRTTDGKLVYGDEDIVYVPISSNMIVECALYTVDGLCDIMSIYEYAKDHFADSAPMASLYSFLSIAFKNGYDFDYTFYIPDDYSSIPWVNGIFYYNAVYKTVTSSNTVNFDFGNVGDMQ